jgi:hypothetical protein
MKLQTILMIFVVCLSSLAAMAQQEITIRPGDNVYEVLQTVVEPGSTIAFEPGLYKIFPPADRTGSTDLIVPPPGTTIRGAGFGFNPEEDTILDCQSLFRHGFFINDDAKGVTVGDLTITNTYGNLMYINGDASDVNFDNVWAVRSLLRCVENDGGEVNFNFCVLGLASDDVIFNDDNTERTTFTNCDIFLCENDLIEAQAGEAVFRNCIFYAGNGNNYLENNGGKVVVRSSVGWDPFSSDAPGITESLFGRLRLDDAGGVFPDVDGSNVGEDPLYVRPPGQIAPGVGVVVEEMDLRLREGSLALTAGSTSFDANGEPNGLATFAGSQGESSYFVVDDFESYNDIDPPAPKSHRIFESWIDGFGVATNGSLVGHDPPQTSYAETTIVHGGNQSMPIWYDNSAALVSEVTRTFDPMQDWSRSGITTLSLFMKQVADQGNGDVYIKINNTEIDLVHTSTYPPGRTPGWVRYNVDLDGMNVMSVQSLTIGIAGAGVQGVLYVDDIRLYKQTSDVTATKQKCLFISESSTAVPDPKDEILINYLEDKYMVDIATGDDVKAHLYSVDDFKQYDFLFVSESVSSSDTKDLKGAPVPVFYTELWASKWDVTGWVPTNESGTYYGNTTVDEAVVKIVDGVHPLAAGFATGTEITVVTDSENATDYLTYSVPQVDHIPIATLAADETKVVVMGVEAGTVLYNEQNVKDGSLVSTARCAAVGINANANNFLTDDAFKLIQAGMDWILAKDN